MCCQSFIKVGQKEHMVKEELDGTKGFEVCFLHYRTFDENYII